MLSSFIPDILKPVSVMCGLAAIPGADEVKGKGATSAIGISEAGLAKKPVSRCISSASTDDSNSSCSESISDAEVINRMASLGRLARKAGRHVLVGRKLVLSR
jgi:hypothetical protein